MSKRWEAMSSVDVGHPSKMINDNTVFGIFTKMSKHQNIWYATLGLRYDLVKISKDLLQNKDENVSINEILIREQNIMPLTYHHPDHLPGQDSLRDCRSYRKAIAYKYIFPLLIFFLKSRVYFSRTSGSRILSIRSSIFFEIVLIVRFTTLLSFALYWAVTYTGCRRVWTSGISCFKSCWRTLYLLFLSASSSKLIKS